MVTFKAKAIQLMVNNGMFESDAAKVFEQVEADPANDAMKGRWNDDVNGYPPQMVNILWLSVKRNAAEWIATNQPQAWYRPMFEDNAPQASATAL